MSGNIYSFTNTASGTVLDLNKSLPDNGTPVISWPWLGGKNQQWKLIEVGQRGIWPIYKIQNTATGTYVDLLNGGSDDGTPVNGWKGNEDAKNPHQNWQLISDISGQLVKIQNVGTGTFLYLPDSKNGTQVTIRAGPIDLSDPADTRQVWRIKRM